MRQPWIHSAKADALLILSPPFLVLATVFLFQETLVKLNENYSFFTWLLLIVFVDVSHVYSTLFKTYLVRREFQARKKLYIAAPLLSLALGLLLYQFGSLAFWSVLALVAVFHFIRQQYGFMRLYARFEAHSISKKIDTAAIYAATLYPMLYWFSTPRKFTWFVDNEFMWLKKLSNILPVATVLYTVILGVWVGKTLADLLKRKEFNLPKNLVIVGTFLSWYFGIVYFNNDLIFTFLNVVSHGIPYIGLIYLNEIRNRKTYELKDLSFFKTGFGAAAFVATLLAIAFSEEFLWEVFVWRENISFGNITISESWHMILVPLLTVPQLTHYILDGFIWKKPKK